ncbi:MAG: glycerophosphodiester phosphodiesterase [Acidimicrobiia bacterium]
MIFSESAVWGHRGWPSRFPDNTVAGIHAAATVAEGVEIDIRRSADGRLVLSHDPEIAGHVVAESLWSGLAAISVDGHPAAVLADVLDVPVMLDLEVKNDPTEPGFDPTHRLAMDVAAHAREGDVVTSFWWPSMDAIRASGSGAATGLLFEAPVDPVAAIRHAVDHGHRSIAPHHLLIHALMMDTARTEGIEVVAWTVDDAHEAIRLAELGVAAIITNRPGELIAEAPTVRDAT